MPGIEQYSPVGDRMTGVSGFLLPSALLSLFFELSLRYDRAHGIESGTLAEKGLANVVIRWHIEISRLPKLGEKLHIVLRPGKIRVALFPYFFSVTDDSGETIIEAAAVRTFIDLKKRSLVYPSECGISFETDDIVDRPFPRRSFCPSLTPAGSFTVPSEYIDNNGHMNNVRYLELAQSRIVPPDGKALRLIDCEYALELLPGQTVSLSTGGDDCTRCVSLDGECHHFHTVFKYE